MTITTSGNQISDIGYTLIIDDTSEEDVPVSSRNGGDSYEDALSLNLAPGSYEIQLTGTTPNCSIESDNPVFVSIKAGESISVRFSVTCKTALNNKVVFVSDRDGPMDLYVADPGETPGEGFSNYKRLTNDDYQESTPAISSDGTKIVYVQSGNIWVINADGTEPVQLTNSRLDSEPTWFAGNTKIAFISNRDEIPQLYVMNADGSGETRLATEQVMSKPVDQTTPLLYQGKRAINQDDEDKASPKLMTVMGGGDDAEIVILDLDDDGDGITDTVPLTNNDHFDGYPALSPDGSELLIVVEDEKGTKNFRLIDAETGETLSTSELEPGSIDDQAYPAWSPDGSEIIFTSVNQVRAKSTSSAAMAQDYNSSRSNKPSSGIEIDTDKTDFNVKHVVWSPAW